MFSVNKFVNSQHLDTFLSNLGILPCDCVNSSFVDKYHSHIITGNLRIINNSIRRNIFCKGPENRENKVNIAYFE